MINTKYDWYQNRSHVFINYKVEGADASQVDVQVTEKLVTLKLGD
jgi:HSP20 family molecular chaperone IbpA